jgi:hypothetical protein
MNRARRVCDHGARSGQDGGMDFGVGYFPTHDGIGPGPLARMLEERGQELAFFAEQPTSRRAATARFRGAARCRRSTGTATTCSWR